MVDTKRMWRDRLRLISDFLLKLVHKRPGWGYISLARIGLAVVGLGVSALIPGFWETILNWLLPRLGISRADTTVESAFANQTLIAGFIIAAGLVIIFSSFWLYHRHTISAGISTENDGSINLNVQQNSTVGGLIKTIADVNGKAVDLSRLCKENLDRLVVPGDLTAPDFEGFLRQLAARARPPLTLTWSSNQNFYALRRG